MRLSSISLGFLAIALTTSGALAQQGTAQQRAACAPDVFRLCVRYIPNVDNIVACLRGNEDRLSPACHTVMFEPSTTADDPQPQQINRSY